MHLYSTDQGIARAADDGHLELLDLAEPDLGALLQLDPNLETARTATPRATIAIDSLTLTAPVPRPGAIYCIGANYPSHVEEIASLSGKLDPDALQRTLEKIRFAPMFFSVPANAISGPTDPIELPGIAPDQVDYEIELALVIGKGGRNISSEQALACVAGLTVANDVSARDIQAEAMTGHDLEFGHAKGLDGFKPTGPALVTLDTFDDPGSIKLEARVNGEVRQAAQLSELIHDLPTCVSQISRYHTLRPGDIVLTGSPAGVGYFRGVFLQPGDVVEMEASGIGTLRNTVTAPREASA